MCSSDLNYRIGINNQAPQYELDVTGNIITSNGHIYTGANLQYDIGSYTNYWRTGYFGNVYGTIQTAVQPNITTVGNITNLNVTGNLTVGGVTIANITASGNITAGNVTAQTLFHGNAIGTTATYTGSITAQGDVVAAGKSLDNHIHSDPQGGNTSPPL